MNMTRPPLDLLDHHDQEPLRISFHEEERDLDVSGKLFLRNCDFDFVGEKMGLLENPRPSFERLMHP